MKTFRLRCALAALLSGHAVACLAQYRDGPPVAAPPPPPAAARAPDIVPLFQTAYRTFGSPRIVLFWNRELADTARSTVIDRTTVRDTGHDSANALDKTTQGPAGSATMKESDASADHTRTTTRSSAPEAEALRANRLAPRDAAMLMRAFVQEMNRGGVHFVDRSLAIRRTAALQDAGQADPRSIETDALLAHADLMMEVLMVEDRDTPSGYAFDMRTRDLKRGVEIASVYSKAVPPPPPQRAGHWTAGDGDYVFAQPPAPPPPGVDQVGTALARDVMFALGSSMDDANHPHAVRRAP